MTKCLRDGKQDHVHLLSGVLGLLIVRVVNRSKCDNLLDERGIRGEVLGAS